MHLSPLLLFSLPFARARGVGRYRMANASTASAPTAATSVTSDATFGILTCVLPQPTGPPPADASSSSSSSSADDVWWSTAASDATTWYSSVAWTPTGGPGGPAAPSWSFTSSRSRGGRPHSSLSTQGYCATETEFYTTTETETETSTSLTWYTWTETSTSYSYVYDTVCQNGGGGSPWTWSRSATTTDSDDGWTWTWPPEIPTDTQAYPSDSSFWTPATATSDVGPAFPTESDAGPTARRSTSSSLSTRWFSWDLTGSVSAWPLPTASDALPPDGATETDSSVSDWATDTDSSLPAWVTETESSSYDGASESSALFTTEQPMWWGTTPRYHPAMGGAPLESAVAATQSAAAAAPPLLQRRDTSSLPAPSMVVVTVTVTRPAEPLSSSASLTTPAPATPSSWAAASFSRRCDDSFCSNGNLWCVYWAGYTSWDVSKGPMPGEAHTIIGSC